MNKSLTNYMLIILLALTCCFIGCRADIKRSPIQKNGKLYGVTQGLFRSKWWNYYERGVSFLDGEFWHEAEADFREALKMWDKDKRRIRTYGRHLTDYFPHRELGVVLFHQKQYTEAIEELKASLSTEKSARAEYYLDRARKMRIEQENLDTGPPVVFIESPGQGLVSNKFSVTVTGMATDDTFVKEIQINNKMVRIDLAGPQIPFHMEVPVKAGENAVHVEVRDLTGKTTKTVRKLICDRAGPTLNIDELIPVHSKKGYVIRGYAHDDSGIKEIRVNGRNILKNPAREVMLNHPVILSHGQKKALVVAEDQAGNQTSAQIFPSNQGTDIWPYYSKSGNLLLASLDSSPSGVCYAMNQRGFMTPEKKIGKYETLGKYYALIIGINQYKEWPPLKNAVNDAATLRDVLITRYAFLQENILFRTDKDATWDRLIHDLRYMAGGLDENDNLLIYFSGHGQLDTINGDGYWVPADGRPRDATTWITNSAIRNIVCSGDVRGKNIMIIADSCYSGALLRGEPSSNIVRRDIRETRAQPVQKKSDQVITSGTSALLRGDSGASFIMNDYQERILELAYRSSRQVITSGGMEPVTDSDKKGDNHSLFAYYLLKALKENEHRIIDVEYLFHTKVWGPVAEKGGQRPVVGRLRTKTDQDGQFVLVLKPELAKAELAKAELAKSGDKDHKVFSDRVVRLPDPTPPEIKVKRWDEKKWTVFTDQAFLELGLRDDDGIQKLRINGRNILARPGRRLYLNYLVPLDVGDNRFVIECSDQVGNKTEKEFFIHRQLQKIYELGARMSVIMFPFSVEGSRDIEIENIPLDHFIERNILDHPKYRRRFNIKEPLVRLQLHDQDDASDLARDLGAEFVLKGRVTAKGRGFLQISVSMIEAKTSQSLTYQDVYGENIDRNLIEQLCQGLVVKLWDALPLTEGQIAGIDDDEVIINIGETNQIRPGMHLIFFQDQEPVRDPATGQVLGSDVDELGAGRIRKLLPKMSYAELLDATTLPRLSVGDRLVMK